MHHVGAFPTLEDQMCFPAGTLIETFRGHKPIERLNPGDLVLTRGRLCPIKIACKTGCSSWFVVIETTDGRQLRCTLNHPIFDAQNHQFVPAKTVWPGMRLDARPSPANMVCRSRGAADGITGWQKGIIDTLRGISYIAQFGNCTAALFQTAITSITKTKIPEIINRGIWSYCPQPSMWLSTSPEALGFSATQSGPLTLRRPGRDAATSNSNAFSAAGSAPRARSADANSATTTADVGIKRLWQLKNAIARHVGSYSLRATNAKYIAVRSVTIEHITVAENVYNLAVDGLPEYYANGVLVHNCGFTPDLDRKTAGFSPDRVDALVWALSDLLVEQMPNSGIFELYREQARKLAEANVKPAPVTNYAPGSVEWEAAQRNPASS